MKFDCVNSFHQNKKRIIKNIENFEIRRLEIVKLSIILVNLRLRSKVFGKRRIKLFKKSKILLRLTL